MPNSPTFFDSLETRLTRTVGTFRMVGDVLVHIHEAILRGANPVVAPASITWLLGRPEILVEALRKNASLVLTLSGCPTRSENSGGRSCSTEATRTSGSLPRFSGTT